MPIDGRYFEDVEAWELANQEAWDKLVNNENYDEDDLVGGIDNGN